VHGRCGAYDLTPYLGTGLRMGYMRSGEVAALAGVNAETLRYYERRGLLDEPPRSVGGYRAYPDGAVEVVRFVKRTQELGFSLGEIDELLHLAGGGPDDCDQVRILAEIKMEELARRIRDLNRMRDSLADLVSTCSFPRRDRRCPMLSSLHTDQGERP
jgi:MerR family mercuric resistance operon transcriptional regulator